VEQSEIGNRHLSPELGRAHTDQIEQGVRELVRFLLKDLSSTRTSASLFVSDNKVMFLPGFVEELYESVVKEVQEVGKGAVAKAGAVDRQFGVGHGQSALWASHPEKSYVHAGWIAIVAFDTSDRTCGEGERIVRSESDDIGRRPPDDSSRLIAQQSQQSHCLEEVEFTGGSEQGLI